MDNNVSKNTFSHKFFKLGFPDDKPTISVKQLLKYNLLKTLNLYRQKSNIGIELEFISIALDRKIILLQFPYRPLSSKAKPNSILSELQSAPVVYRCAIAFPLAQHCQLSPQMIAESLVDFLSLSATNSAPKAYLRLAIRAVYPGWIDFHLSDRYLAIWLEQSLIFLEEKLTLTSTSDRAWPKNNQDLFPLQYVHARCCSLLRLGAREKLIVLKDGNFLDLVGHLAESKPIIWLDQSENFWLTHEAEYCLLRQLLTVVDSFASESENWIKLAVNLSEAILTFEAECPIVGFVTQKTPNKAIARLGLIALVQYWLQKLLSEKIGVEALTEL